jgi:hypothetical protein
LERAVRKLLMPGEVGTQWSAAAYKHAKAFIHAHEDARITVFSTYPPFGTHFAGYWLSRKTHLPWIADFRDPLTNNLKDVHINPLRKPFYRKLEHLFIDEAKCILANTDTARDNFQRRYPARAQNIHVLWNGFDPEQRLHASAVPHRQQKVFSHVGELYGRRDISPLLKSIQRLLDSNRLSPKDIYIQLIGPALPTTLPDQAFLSAAVEQGWLKLVSQLVPQEEAQRISCTSDGLLLVQPQSMLQVPAKLYEYVQIGRPVLAFIPRGSPVERILQQSGIAYQCAYVTDPPQVFDESVFTFFQLDSSARQPSAWFEDNFNTQHHAEQLYKLIRKLHGEGDRTTTDN